MIYLLAKYTLLFLLASVLGFALGYWWSRRNFVDVSESYEDLRKAAEHDDTEKWSLLWNRFDALPEPKEADLSGVFQRLDQVSTSIDQLPRPEKTDLQSVESRLDALTKEVAGLPQPTDVEPLTKRIDALEKAVRNIPQPHMPKEVNLKPVETELASIRSKIAALPVVETHEAVDLGPVTRRIESLEQKVARIPQPNLDLTPINRKIDALEQKVSRIPQPKLDLVPVTRKIDSLEQKVTRLPRPEKVDIKPISDKLRTIESGIVRLDKHLARPAKAPAKRIERPRQQRRSEPRILSAALYGKKDDLKKISGVGPKLERLLNKNGVFYFWQVASWSRKDIGIIDERLDAFKGRISRDNWVSQAKDLKKLPDAAAMPTNP